MAHSAPRLAPREWAVLRAAREAGRLTAPCDPLTGLPAGWAKRFGGDGASRFFNEATGEEVEGVDGMLRALGASVLQEAR